MNRLLQFFGQSPEPETPNDYFEIESRYETFAVSKQTASDIERRLDHRPPSRWVVFRDLTGARHRILTANITRISECTAAQRAASREFYRARRLENKSERPWEDDT